MELLVLFVAFFMIWMGREAGRTRWVRGVLLALCGLWLAFGIVSACDRSPVFSILSGTMMLAGLLAWGGGALARRIREGNAQDPASSRVAAR